MNKTNKHKKENILINNKAEFKRSLVNYFRFEKEPRDESHVGLEILFTINPIEYNTTSKFDIECQTKFVAKVVDAETFQKFYKDSEGFSFKYTDCKTLEEFNEELKMELKLQEISSKEFQVIKSIKELIGLMDDESLKFALNEPNFWKGEIGHIKRKIILYANTIPSFEVLELQNIDNKTDEDIIKDQLDFVKSEMDYIKKSIDRPPTEEKWVEIEENWRKMCTGEWDGPETPYVKYIKEFCKNWDWSKK